MEWHSQVRQAYDELRVVPPAVLSGSFSPPLLHCKAAHPEQFPLSGAQLSGAQLSGAQFA